jgi:hypothetical protein
VVMVFDRDQQLTDIWHRIEREVTRQLVMATANSIRTKPWRRVWDQVKEQVEDQLIDSNERD